MDTIRKEPSKLGAALQTFMSGELFLWSASVGTSGIAGNHKGKEVRSYENRRDYLYHRR